MSQEECSIAGQPVLGKTVRQERASPSHGLLGPPLPVLFLLCTFFLPPPTVQGPFLVSEGLTSSAFFAVFSFPVAYED